MKKRKAAKKQRSPATAPKATHTITCGDFGGVTADGMLCSQPAGFGTGRHYGPCKKHLSADVPRLNDPNKHAFLVAYALTANITRACASAGISRQTHYNWLERDERYKEAFDLAHDMAIDNLEIEARRRAIHGTERAVYHQGREVGRIREYSDTLLIFLLKGARPEKYRERHDVQLDGKLNVSGVLMVPTPVSADEWSAIAAQQQAGLVHGATQPAAPALPPPPSRFKLNGNGNGNSHTA